uniref:Exosome complex component RRP45 n=2 Tax=Ascaris TaxID=6251 RepID=A0A0M3HX40_ASCLU
MRDEPLSNCERDFILSAFAENVRLDGRKCDEFRDLKVVVGAEFGTSLVMAGSTKVSAQVTCNIVEPKSARGNMGAVEVHVDMSPMGSPTHEDGRLGPKGIELTRVLELLCRDCGAVDLEALCLTAYKKVWQIRVDVHILQADGALIDCASVAAITALAHFRRPDVTVLVDSILVHGSDKKAPIPLTVYHMPICVSFGIAPDGEQVVIDPTEREAMCLKGAFVVAANKRHEVCALHQTGNLLLNEQLIVRCVDMAIQRAIDVTELISTVLTDDNNKRLKGSGAVGFAGLISLDMLTSHRFEPNELIAPTIDSSAINVEPQLERVTITEKGIVHIGEGGTPFLAEMGPGEHELIEQVEDIAAVHVEQTSLQPQKETVNSAQELLDSIEEELAMLLPEGSLQSLERTPHGGNTDPHDAPVELSAAIRKKKKKTS